MKLIKSKLAAILQLLLSYYPRPLPSGVTAFNQMAERVRALAGNICTLDDTLFVISTNIMRLDPHIARASDHKFVNIIRNAAAKQISSVAFQDLKNKQAAAQAAAQQQQAEATASTAAASDGEKTSIPK